MANVWSKCNVRLHFGDATVLTIKYYHTYRLLGQTGQVLICPRIKVISYLIIAHYMWLILIYRCVPFPHPDLLCGQYIDPSTTVYIDKNVFNYTEVNNRIIELDNYGRAFGPGILNSCQWIAMYMICLQVYPQCNNVTQALIRSCIDECLNYSCVCDRSLRSLYVSDAKLILDCSDPFRLFDSIHVNTENCYHFTCKLI